MRRKRILKCSPGVQYGLTGTAWQFATGPTGMTNETPLSMLRPNRKITGMSAILLPLGPGGAVDWKGFERHTARTLDCGLTPAVNMDTGYANLIDDAVRTEALRRAKAIASGRPFVAGAFVGDSPGDAFNPGAYRTAIDRIQHYGGTPIVFQSFGLTSQSDDDIAAAYDSISVDCDRFLAFELGEMFADFGKIYSLDLYRRLMENPRCYGAKHSSLRRSLEWQRLSLRDSVRPDFLVLTGNDLAIDMVMYGSDYLLGLSTFAPECFARRDAWWESGDDRFYELNDLLQYLGAFAFRDPVPAYKHSAAMFLHSRGWIASNQTHAGSPTRPESDQKILDLIARDLDALVAE